MKRTIVLSIFCMLVMVGTVDARHHMGARSADHGQGGMMGGSGGGMKGGCGMMGGGKGGGMMGGKMGSRMGGGGKGGHGGSMHGAMGTFHHWMHRVMNHREAFNLSSDQMDRIAELSALHAQNAIRNKAEHRVLKIDYKQALRKKNIDMNAVEKILKKQADLHFRDHKAGVTFYTQILGLLTPEQKEMIWDSVGRPFPYPWEKVRHHGGGHHMQGGHHDYRRPTDSNPSSEKGNPNKT